MQKLITTYLLILFAIMFATGCKKSKDSAEQIYVPLCKKVTLCEPRFRAIPDAEKQCIRALKTVQKKLPAAIPQILDCLERTPCDELDMNQCAANAMMKVRASGP